VTGRHVHNNAVRESSTFANNRLQISPSTFAESTRPAPRSKKKSRSESDSGASCAV
jgi:hypothetical protein